MTTEERHRKQFQIVKYWAGEQLSKRKAYVSEDHFRRLLDELKDQELSDARCLFRMIVKEVDQHNTKIATKITLLRNLKFVRNWSSSKVFAGMSIPNRAIDNLIEKYPDKDDYQIFRALMGWVIDL